MAGHRRNVSTASYMPGRRPNEQDRTHVAPHDHHHAADGAEFLDWRRARSGDTLIEGDGKIVTRKWQGHPPENLAVIGKPQTPLRVVVEPRYRGTAEYATRVHLPNMLYARFLRTTHPHVAIKRLDTSKAERMPGVAYILTHRNAPPTNPMQTKLMMQNDIVAIVVADSEDLAEDAVEAIEVEYIDLPSVAICRQRWRRTRQTCAKEREIYPVCARTIPTMTRRRAGVAPRRGRERISGVRRRQGVHLLLRRRPGHSDSAVQRGRRLGGRQAHVLGPRAGHLSLTSLAGRMARHAREQRQVHQQMERLHVRRLWRSAADCVLGPDRLHRKGDGTAGEGGAHQGRRTGQRAAQAGNRFQVQGRTDEGRPNPRAAV